MRRIFLALALLCAILAAGYQGLPAHGGTLTLLGAGKAPAGSSVIPITLTSPNDFSNAAWSKVNDTVLSTTEVAPTGATTASQVQSNDPGFAGSGQVIGITLSAGPVYSITGYVKSIAAPVWMRLLVYDGSSGWQVNGWVNTATSATGTTSVSGGGVVDNWVTTPDANGYTKVVMTFHFTTTPSAGNLVLICFADSDGGTTPGVADAIFDLWGWGA